MKTFETEKGNIPEGATHYSDEAEGKYFCWYNISEEAKICVLDGVGFGHKWHRCTNEHKGADVKPIPSVQTETPEDKQLCTIKQVKWSGEGLPPVGAECEVRFRSDGEWTDWFSNGKLKAGYDSKLWFSHNFGDCVYPAHDVEFRKPETPEQRKERERIENGKAFYESMNKIELSVMDEENHGTPNSWGELRDEWKEVYILQAEYLGYRKGE